MENLADISVFENLQSLQNAMKMPRIGVFNDQKRIDRIRHLFEKAQNTEEANELLKLIEEETKYWGEQNKDALTDVQRKEALEYLQLIEQMDGMLPKSATTIEDCFTVFPHGHPQG